MEDIAFLIAQHLKQEILIFKDEDKKESLEVALQCIETTYGFSINSKKDIEKYNNNEYSLSTLISHGKKQFQIVKEQNLDAQREAEELKIKGNEAMKENNYELAVETYTKAISIYQSSPILYINRAAAYTKLNNFDHAISDCNKGIEIDPNYSKAHSRLGTCHFINQNYSRAYEAYKKALELEPENEMYQQNLLMAENKLEKTKEKNSNSEINPNFNLSELMNNPELREMANQLMQSGDLSNLMNSPQMASIAERFGLPRNH